MRLVNILFAIIPLLIISCSQSNQTGDALDDKILKDKIANYLITQNSIGENRVDTLLTENFIRNMNGIEMVSNLNEHKANMHIFLTGFPDIAFTFPTQLIKDNQAFVEWTFLGTHSGTFGELTATGKKVKINGITHLYFNEMGKIYREDMFYNELDLLQQLGYTIRPPMLK